MHNHLYLLVMKKADTLKTSQGPRLLYFINSYLLLNSSPHFLLPPPQFFTDHTHMEQLLPIRVVKKRTRDGLLVGWPPIKSSTKIMITASATISSPPHRGFVGWPPIKSSRKKISAGGSCGQPRRVRVEMEGVELGIKKVPVCLHNSYHSLLLALDCMFLPSFLQLADGATRSRSFSDGRTAKLVYKESEEGEDWMLVSSVPWEIFVGSVKRLKIIPASNLTSGINL